MGNLAGKVAIVTGSSRGIGRVIPFGIASLHAERLGRDGANVVVTYVGNQDKAEQVVSAIKANGSDAISLQVDMREIEDVRHLFQKTLDHFGKLDILVNNAAGRNIFKPTAEITQEEYNNFQQIIHNSKYSEKIHS